LLTWFPFLHPLHSFPTRRSSDLAMAYLLTLQHEDGTIDLMSTNFHSTPDTGFIAKRLCNAWRLIDRLKMKESAPLLEKIKTFLRKAADALTVGGIHTPNHRWVVCGALASIYALWPDRKSTRLNSSHVKISYAVFCLK